MVLMTAPSPPSLPPPPLSEGLDPPLSYTSGSVYMFQKSGHQKISQIKGKKKNYSLGLGATSHFTYCQVFWVVLRGSRTVPVFPVLVHADSLDEVLRCDYSK